MDGDVSHPRIEGLPPRCSGRWRDADRKEVLWTTDCHHSSGRGRSKVWDPMTMARPCNTFFELVVGLMKGNVFEPSQNATVGEESSNFGLEQTTLVQLVQRKAIDLVLALMSDAPPYDHAEDSYGRTPYLWKFWFDSLLPSYSTAQTVTGQGSSKTSSDTHSIGDFLSPWEKRDSHCNHLLGSGRKHSTRLLRDTHNDAIQQSKQSAGKQGRASNRSSRGSSTPDASKGKKIKSELLPLFYDGRKQRERLSIDIKSRILQLLSHFVLCSSSVYQNMHQIVGNGKEKAPLAKRILAAVLDEMEETIVPFLSSCSSSDFRTHDAELCLQLCYASIQFLLIMSRSNEGIRMLRVQMRLESEQGDPSRWSQSAIGCVTSVLDRTLSFAMGMEEKENDVVLKSTHLAHALNAIVDQCIIFFKTLLLFVNQKRKSSSKAATFLALISEHRTIFQSCCQRILARQSPNSIADPPRLLHFSERLIYHVRYLFEEVVMDEEEENREGR